MNKNKVKMYQAAKVNAAKELVMSFLYEDDRTKCFRARKIAKELDIGIRLACLALHELLAEGRVEEIKFFQLPGKGEF